MILPYDFRKFLLSSIERIMILVIVELAVFEVMETNVKLKYQKYPIISID